MKLLVVGTGRSGTGWCSTVLRSAGLDVGHEAVFGPRQALGEDPVDWWQVDGDCSWLAVPLLPVPDTRTALVVRHPLDVVASLAHIGFGTRPVHTPYAQVAERFAGPIDTPTGLLRFWTIWNRRAHHHANVTFTLDQLTADPTVLTRWAGAPDDAPSVSGPVNGRDEWKHGPRPTFGWNDFNPDVARQARADWNRYMEVADGVRNR